ncbi:hypothetical protein WR25_09844 [Diploscapter pachys]|uniref:Uncharacterized protein n=1 Tax=Diploscapter pachys TaxID=2018661 RepID=A0A2A2M5U9_9BILA|nr:hypothetical protein WR25_09844 [Diploscapter pachys]
MHRPKVAMAGASRTRPTGCKPCARRCPLRCTMPVWMARPFAHWRCPASNTVWCCSTPKARCCARPNSGATPKARLRTRSCSMPSAVPRARLNASGW